MEINEAIRVAKQLRNQYRVFETLDSFLKKVAEVQGSTNDLLAERDRVQKEVEVLRKKKEDDIALMEKEVRDAKDRASVLMAGIDDGLKRAEKAVSDRREEEKSLKSSISSLKGVYEGRMRGEEKAFQDRKSGMEKEEGEVRVRLESARRELEDLKKKLQ